MGDVGRGGDRGRGGGAGAVHDDRGFRPRLPRLRGEGEAGVRGRTERWPTRPSSPGRSSRSATAASRASCGAWAASAIAPLDRPRTTSTAPAGGSSRRSARPAGCAPSCRRPMAGCAPASTCARSASPARRSPITTGSPISPSPCRGSAPAPITLFGSEELKQRYLPPVGAGRGDRGLRALRARGRLRRRGDGRPRRRRTAPDHVRIDGEKTWISNGGIADHYVVFARTGEAPGAKGLSAFVVDADAPGLDDRRAHRGDRAASARDAALRGLPRAARAAHRRRRARASRSRWRRSTCSARRSARRRSASRGARSTRRSARAATRQLFGAPLGDLQLTQAALADMATASMRRRSSSTAPPGRRTAARRASRARRRWRRCYATEAAQGVIDKAVQLFGGLGVTQGRQGRGALPRDPGAAHLRGRDRGAEDRHRARDAEAGAAPPAESRVSRRWPSPAARRLTSPLHGRGERDVATPPISTPSRATTCRRAEQWPDFLFTRPELQYPARLNCVHALPRPLDRGGPGRCALPHRPGRDADLCASSHERVNRIANVLVGELGLVPGSRVLLRSANTPMMVAAYLAVLKAGGVVVATMPLLRAQEIAYPIDKAQIALALCDHRLSEELEKARPLAPGLAAHRLLGRRRAGRPRGADGRRLAATSRPSTPPRTTSASSASPPAPPASRRARCISIATCSRSATPTARNVLRAEPDDRFIGSPPLAFTFGLGGARAVPAARRRLDGAAREGDARTSSCRRSQRHRATVCFTAPTAYRAMLGQARRARRLIPAQMRLGRRAAAEGDLRRLAGRDRAQAAWTASARPRCCTSSSPRARTRSGPARPASRCRATRRRSSTRTARDAAAGRGRPARGARPDRLPLPRRRAPARTTCENGWNVTGDTYRHG